MRNAMAVLLALSVTTQVTATSRVALTTEVKIPGATLRIELQQPIDDEKAAQIIEWLRSASANVSLAYGRFPNPSPRIVVIPADSHARAGGSPVPFGRVTRNREETIELYVNIERPIEEFYDDWTATHEFSHLMLPSLHGRHRWISEGFASYYQNVLMSRAGRYTPERAWEKLHAGFERGRASRPELSLNDAAAAGVRQARMKIYWSGAAIALLADIELRERSGGKESLDIALERLQSCCLPATRSWSGPELFTRLDSLLDREVFMPLYRRYANKAGFPDVSDALVRLGVDVRADSVRLQQGAALAPIRDAITGRAPL